MHSTHNTANFSDWLIFQNQVFSLVMMLTLITLSPYDFSQPDSHHACPSQIYYRSICYESLILWKNHQAYNIEGTVQHEKEQKNQGSCPGL